MRFCFFVTIFLAGFAAYADVPPVSGGSIAPDNSQGFSLQLVTPIGSFIHEANGSYGASIDTTHFSAPCKISEGTTGKDLFCLLEASSLYDSAPLLQIQVPTDMCAYFQEYSYDFFAFAPGNGPSAVSYKILSDGTIHDANNADASGNAVCAYDYSATAGPNCCVGNYEYKVCKEIAGNGPPGSGAFQCTTSQKSWGGNAANCIAGPGNAVGQSMATGLPEGTLYSIKDIGLNRTMAIDSIGQQYFQGKTLQSNVWTANYYSLADNNGMKPLALQTMMGYEPHDSYSWTCLDPAGGIINRIRLMVRAWNGPVVEGGDPSFNPTPLTTPSRLDWKDFSAVYPGGNL